MKEQLVCGLAQMASELGATGLVGLIAAVGALGTILATIGRRIAALRPKGSPAPGPPWLMATLIAIGIYALARLVDPLLSHDLGPAPLGVQADAWSRVGYFESVLLGRSWAAPLLPLEDHPTLAVMIHAALWPLLVVLIRFILVRWPSSVRAIGVDIRYDTPDADLPRWWIGATTARKADDRFKRWSTRLLFLLVPLHLTAGGLMAVGQRGNPVPRCGGAIDETLGAVASEATDVLDAALGDLALQVGHPAPGMWILGGLLIFVWTLHLLLPGRPQEDDEEEEKEEEEETEEEEVVATTLLEKLTSAVAGRAQDEAATAALEASGRSRSLGTPQDAADGRTVPPPEGLGPMVVEVLRALTGQDQLHAHQSGVLDHLVQAWRVEGGRGEGDTPSLEEEVARSPVRAQTREAPHALLSAAERSGRSTVAMLAAVHVAMDRGGSTLVVLPEEADVRGWTERFRDAIQRSPARWSVSVVEAGDALSTMLLGGEIPTVVVTDIDRLDASVLADARAEPFLDRLALVVADDVDDQVGIAEMHLHLMMRRLWALDETRRALMEERGFPTLLLAVAGPEPRPHGEPASDGRLGWARHLLAAPLRLFGERSSAPRAARLVLRRTDLRGPGGSAPSAAALAEACEAAGLRWHARRAGDGHRRRERLDLPRGERHTDDPREAEVVLIDGGYLDARREAVRLLHAGAMTEDRAAILVLAAPAHEAVVLHQEASDGEPLARLPRPATVVEPRVLRQRHLERALGRAHEREALRRRLGGDLGDSILDRLERTRQIRTRKHHLFDPKRDAPVAREVLQTAREQPLGEPIDPRCVGDVDARVELIDEGTATVIARVDAAVASVKHPPGSLVRHRLGTFVVLRDEVADSRRILLDHADPTSTTSVVEAAVRVDDPSPETIVAALEERSLGGRPTKVGLRRVQLTERASGVRRYGDGELRDERRFETPAEGRYATDGCFVHTPFDEEGAATLMTACRFALRTAVRGSEGLADVSLVELQGAWHLIFFDRVPGGGGFAATIDREALRSVFSVARLAMERLRLDALDQFRAAWDPRPRALQGEWRERTVLAWLDGLLDREKERRRTARGGYTPGEGQRGDLGRLWVGQSGRADELIWTRHRWESTVALTDSDGATIPPGEVFFDAGIERSILSAPRRRTSDSPLAPFAKLLEERAGAHYEHTALALVCAIPTRPDQGDTADRDPARTFFTRHADPLAKALLLQALVPRARIHADDQARVAIQLGDTFYSLDNPTPEPLPDFEGKPLAV
ncbi:MAG: hypothetical protein JJ863_38390 [Deltaproteobacteria bacterium]|nr:hypothetical protein [Deltaproteobacteria bacterium]